MFDDVINSYVSITIKCFVNKISCDEIIWGEMFFTHIILCNFFIMFGGFYRKFKMDIIFKTLT